MVVVAFELVFIIHQSFDSKVESLVDQFACLHQINVLLGMNDEKKLNKDKKETMLVL